jgi:hypothetical protein
MLLERLLGVERALLDGDPAAGRRATGAGCSFRVALRSQPIYAPTSLQPLVNFSLALKTPDVSDLGCGVVSLDLPIVLCDALVFEIDARFAHGAFLRQRPLRVSRSKKSPAGAEQLDLRKSAKGAALGR